MSSSPDPQTHSTDWVLVTGAAGFIGSTLCERLLEQGRRVVGIDNFDPFYGKDLKERNLDAVRARDAGRGHFVFHEGSFDAPELWEKLRAQTPPSLVIHLAAHAGVRPSIERPLDYYENNVLAWVRLLQEIVKSGCQNVVFTSSSSVYGSQKTVPFAEDAKVDDPRSPYAATKKSGEEILSTYAFLYGLRAYSLRLFTVYGPRQRPDLALRSFFLALSQGKPITLFGDGSTYRDYTFVEDTVAGFIAAASSVAREPQGSHEVFNLGAGQPITLKDMVLILSNAMGVTPEIHFAPRHPADVERTWASIAKAREKIGYEPRVSFEQGVARFVDWARSQESR